MCDQPEEDRDVLVEDLALLILDDRCELDNLPACRVSNVKLVHDLALPQRRTRWGEHGVCKKFGQDLWGICLLQTLDQLPIAGRQLLLRSVRHDGGRVLVSHLSTLAC